MAVSTKKLDFAASVKHRLDFLECSYIEGMDESSIADMLLTPGEGRLKILEWLFSRYDYKLEELLDMSLLSFGTRSESRLQRLLTAACSMCLCQSDDADLIRGDGSLSRQVNFIDKLLDLVCIRQKCNCPDSSVKQANVYIDKLVSQDGFADMLTSKIELLPRDIHAEVERMWIKGGWNREKSFPSPSLRDLTIQSDNLASELSENAAALENLQKQVILQESSKEKELVTMTHMLATVLKELHQLADGFTYCYETQISQWCNRAPPELSELGVVFKRVHALLQKFIKMFEDLDRIRQIHTKLNKNTKKESESRSQVLAQASREASDSFQWCLSVLEETIHRTEANFSSRYVPVFAL